MSSVFSEVPTKGMRKAHFRQLLSYVKAVDWHCGHQAQFNKRHAEIERWVQGIVDVVKLPQGYAI
jgi:hypothetical protein